MGNLLKLGIFITVFCVSTFSASFISAQKKVENVSIETSMSSATKMGSITSLKHTLRRKSTHPEKRASRKKFKSAPKNFIGRELNQRNNSSSGALDPVNQSADLYRNINVRFNIEGLSFERSPSDPSGYVGLEHYIQMVNASSIGIYDKTGNLIETFEANTLWSEINQSSAGDPIVQYDRLADRWFLTEFTSSGLLLIAVSKSTNPLEGWTLYSFMTPNFPDYPKYSIWNDYLTVTTNEEGAGVLHAYIFDKNQFYTEAENVDMQRVVIPGSTNESGFFVASPVNMDSKEGNEQNPLYLRINDSSWGEVEEDVIEMYEIDVNMTMPDSTKLTKQSIVVTPFDSYPCRVPGSGFSCIPQKDGEGVDGIPEVIMHQAQYKKFSTHESIVLSFITDVDGTNLSGIRWTELRNSENGWKLYQEGTFTQPDDIHRFMSSIAMDDKGNIAMGYNVSSENMYIGLRATGRLANDPLGQMTFIEFPIAEGKSTNNSFGRQGDYAHMTVDPVNGNDFYFTSEYSAENNKVHTRISSFFLKPLDYDVRVISVNSPLTNDTLGLEKPSIVIQNTGINPVDSVEVFYEFKDSYSDTTTLSITDEKLDFEFTQDIETSVYKNYDITFHTIAYYPDTVLRNTRVHKFKKIPTFDVQISIPSDTIVTCSNVTRPEFTIKNNGFKTIDSFAVLLLDSAGMEINKKIFTDKIFPEDEFKHSFEIADYPDGASRYSMECQLFNGEDVFPETNTANFTILQDNNLAEIAIEIQLDEYSSENSWTLVNTETNTVIASKIYDESHLSELDRSMYCAAMDQCFELVLNDSYGDGITEGFVKIYVNGKYIAYASGNFGSTQNVEFCTSAECLLDLELSAQAESGMDINDGSILAKVNGGIPPYSLVINSDTITAETNEKMISNLAGGAYILRAFDSAGNCMAMDSIVVPTCDLDVAIEYVDPKTADSEDGSISGTVTSTSSIEKVTINGASASIDGNKFSKDNLDEGDYIVQVINEMQCISRDTVILEASNAAYDTHNASQRLIIYPNPTDGVIQIELQGYISDKVLLPFNLMDSQGKVIKEFHLAKYDNNYVAPLSLYHLPNGTYYIHLVLGNERILKRIIKI